MPPKAITVQQLYEISSKITESDSPNEADFRTILSAVKSDKDQRKLAAQLIPQHAEKFTKQHKAAVTAQTTLVSDSDPLVRFEAVKNISKLMTCDQKTVLETLIKCLTDDDPRIVQISSPVIARTINSDSTALATIIESLKSQTPEAQCNLIDIIKDNVKFDEENKDKLLIVVESALTSNVFEGLKLLKRNKALVEDETRVQLIEKLVTRLENSLASNFEPVTSEILLPMLRFTRVLGDESLKKILGIIADQVLPKTEQLAENVKIQLLQRIVDLNKLVEGNNMITNVYNHVFLSFPKEEGEINFSVVEATLFAFLKLAKKDYKTASKLAATVFVFTGQPGEADDVEDEEKHKEFVSRLEYIQSQCQPFIDHFKNLITVAKANTTLSQDEKGEKIRTASQAIRTGGNVHQLCRLLLANKILSGKLPAKASWKKGDIKKFNKNKTGQKFNKNNKQRFNNGGNKNQRKNYNNKRNH